MKKVFIVLIICFVIAVSAFFMWSNPELGQDMGNAITTFFDNLIEGKYKEYTTEFKINDLAVSNSDFYFKTLTDDQKKMYTAVAVAVKDIEPVAKIKGYENNIDDIIITDASAAMEAFFADHPEAFYVDMKYEVYTIKSVFGKNVQIKLKYTSEDKNVIKEQTSTLKSKVEGMISGITATTEVEKEIQLHDKLCEMVQYYNYSDINDIPVDKHTSYGALVKNSAVCDGISKAMQILLDKVGIENILVIGQIDELHAWNLVKLDGQWYHLDATSNKSLKDNSNYTIHSYFNITTDEILKTHTIQKREILPEASSSQYNYYIYKNLYIKNIDDFNLKLQSIIKDNKDNKILEFAVEKGMSDVPDKMISSMQTNKNTEYLTENLTKVSYYNILNSYIVKKVL